MKKKFAPHWAYYLLAILFFFNYSCKKIEKEEEKQIPLNISSSNQIESEDYVFGEPKQNPYKVGNMQNAYSSLSSGGILPPTSITIRPTHYYVKFKPANFDQYEKLCEDSILDLSDLPIEANVLQYGEEYHDPSLPDSVPTFQYTAVPVGYSFNDTIPYEILDNLYLPESDSLYFSENSGNQHYLEKLLDQAYIQTGNFEDTIKYDNEDYQRRYYPGGRIQVFDTRLNSFIGMEGVDVHARRWFIVYHAQPDYNGYYRMKHRFNRPCNYSIVFHNIFFVIRRHLIATTYHINGPKKTGDWNYNSQTVTSVLPVMFLEELIDTR
ncbi:MAG: hypothetical protein HOP10_11950 [Chitinophagaceae bacterium]|nr:hypothetical protein [Chitinophagaceae bacterium]